MKPFLLLDNYDSFTYNLHDYIRQCNIGCEVVRNDKIKIEEVENYSAIILSPGPGRPNTAGKMMSIIERYHTEKPILGVCLGHQAIGEYFGAKLHKATKIYHGITSFIHHNHSPLFHHIPDVVEVMRYHSLILHDLKHPLRTTAQTNDGEIMALEHEYLPIFGVQFHPESILTQDGLQIIQNFVALVKKN